MHNCDNIKFEWDDAKNVQNLLKRDLSFDFATRIFKDELRITAPDARNDYGEERFNTIGIIKNRVYVVVYTLRSEAIRIISARKANLREVRYYEEFYTRS